MPASTLPARILLPRGARHLGSVRVVRCTSPFFFRRLSCGLTDFLQSLAGFERRKKPSGRFAKRLAAIVVRHHRRVRSALPVQTVRLVVHGVHVSGFASVAPSMPEQSSMEDSGNVREGVGEIRN